MTLREIRVIENKVRETIPDLPEIIYHKDDLKGKVKKFFCGNATVAGSYYLPTKDIIVYLDVVRTNHYMGQEMPFFVKLVNTILHEFYHYHRDMRGKLDFETKDTEGIKREEKRAHRFSNLMTLRILKKWADET